MTAPSERSPTRQPQSSSARRPAGAVGPSCSWTAAHSTADRYFRSPSARYRVALLDVDDQSLEERGGFDRRQFLDVGQLPLNRPRSPPGLVDLGGRAVQVLLDTVEDGGELGEFRLDRAEQRPHLAGPPFDRERPEPHLEAGQNSPERRWSRNHDAVIALEPIGQPG